MISGAKLRRSVPRGNRGYGGFAIGVNPEQVPRFPRLPAAGPHGNFVALKKHPMKSFVLLTAAALLHLGASAQTLKATTVAPKDSKAAKKAISKGEAVSAGYYWNADRTQLVDLTVFTDKKLPEPHVQVHTISQEGELASTSVEPFTDAFLEGLSITPAELEQEQAWQDFSEYTPAFIQNPKLAGKPDVVFGTFEDRYHSSGLWTGFKFNRSESFQLEEKFWCFVSFPVDGALLNKREHLLAPPGNLGKLFAGYGYRQYLDASSQAYIGGLMATVGGNQFLSGVYDLANRTWISKHEITVGMELLPGQNTFERLPNGHTAILLAGQNQYKCLVVDATGAQVSLTDLGTEKSGGKSNKQMAPVMQVLPKGGAAFATSSYQTVGGKEIGLGFGLVQGGKVAQSWNYSFADLEAAYKLAPKHKVKFKKLKYFELESIRVMRDGSYLVVGYATQDTANGSGRAQLLVHIGTGGELLACYGMESLTAPKDERLTDKLPTTLIATETGFYWIERSNVAGYEKGIYAFTDDFGTYERTTTFRQDRTLTCGQVCRVDLAAGTISSVVAPKSLILGDEIGACSADGTLVLSTEDGLLFVR